MRRTAEPNQARKDSQHEPPLCEEAPVTINVNDRDLATLLCTPSDLRELTVGWLLAEGLIESVDEIDSLAGCAHDREMLVRTTPDRVVADERCRLVTSGCGAGANPGALSAADIPRVNGNASLPLDRLRGFMTEMLRGARLYRLTGGVHSAALAGRNGVLVQREDVGRHNAVDKVIGYALLARHNLEELVLLSTGRLSSEMAWKAARAGIPIVASLSVPSGMARDIAAAAGITLVGRALSPEPRVYTHPARIVDGP